MYGATFHAPRFLANDSEVTARDLPGSRLTRLALLGLIAFCLATATASAQYCTPDECDECNLRRCSQRCCHELPELWLVNTRCAPRCKNLDCGFDRLIYKRYDRQCCRWVEESRESFLAQESTKPTLFYAHGNSLNHKNAMKSCWQIYCKMRCCPGAKRLVFWSWPAERVFKTKGLRVGEMIEKNLRIKYVYAEYQGYYMAKLVNQMSLAQRVMMSGHSYGGIISSAAMHYIGSGCLRGLTLEGSAAVQRSNLRAAVISGAFDHDMLNPGNRYGQAFVAAEKIFVTRNITDRTLKKWPKTSWRCKRAIGVLGVNANCLGAHRNKLCQQTMTDDVGTSHYLTPHLKSVKFVAALCCLSFPDCQNCSVADASAGQDLPQLTSPTREDDQGIDDIINDAEFAGMMETEILAAEILEAQQPFHEDELLAEILDEELVFVDAAIGNNYNIDPTHFPLTDDFSTGQAELDVNRLMAATELNPLAPGDVFGADQPLTIGHALTRQAIRREVTGKDELASRVKISPPVIAPPKRQPTPATEKQAQPPKRDDASVVGITDGTTQDITNAAHQHSIWYRCGLGLAIVLTGQFYISLSKRDSAA